MRQPPQPALPDAVRALPPLGHSPAAWRTQCSHPRSLRALPPFGNSPATPSGQERDHIRRRAPYPGPPGDYDVRAKRFEDGKQSPRHVNERFVGSDTGEIDRERIEDHVLELGVSRLRPGTVRFARGLEHHEQLAVRALSQTLEEGDPVRGRDIRYESDP